MLRFRKLLMKYKLINFLYILIIDFKEKEGFERSSSLSYTILVSFIPFFISIASITTFFLPKSTYYKLEDFILDNSLPVIGGQISAYMTVFHSHAGQLSLISLGFLFLTSILMLNSLNNHLLRVCELETSGIDLKHLMKNFIIMAIGALILGLGTLFISYVSLYFNRDYIFILKGLSIFLTVFTFTLIYRLIPKDQINFKEALIAGITAGFLFEVAKCLFTIYIKHFATQNILYGTLATIPIFLLWIYISCNILLICANINVVRQKRCTRV